MSLLLDIGELGQFTPLRWQKAVHPSPIHAIWHARQNKRTRLAAAAEQAVCIHDNHASLPRLRPFSRYYLLNENCRCWPPRKQWDEFKSVPLSSFSRIFGLLFMSRQTGGDYVLCTFSDALERRMMTGLRSFVKALFGAKTSIGDQAYSYAAGFIDLAAHWQAWRSASASLGQRMPTESQRRQISVQEYGCCALGIISPIGLRDRMTSRKQAVTPHGEYQKLPRVPLSTLPDAKAFQPRD